MPSMILRGVLEQSQGAVKRTFGVEHRLASSAPYRIANPFPASILDVLAGYRYLIETVGFSPKNIIISGDSSGGHIAVDVVRYLATSKFPSLPPPGAAILMSPTMDWADTHRGTPEYTMDANEMTDFVRPVVMGGYTQRSIIGNLDMRELGTNAWFSPGSLQVAEDARELFAGFPPTLIFTSGAEQTVDAARTFRKRLVAANGEENVTYIEYPDAFHDWMVFTWHEPERTNALQEIRRFLTKVYGP